MGIRERRGRAGESAWEEIVFAADVGLAKITFYASICFNFIFF